MKFPAFQSLSNAFLNLLYCVRARVCVGGCVWECIEKWLEAAGLSRRWVYKKETSLNLFQQDFTPSVRNPHIMGARR